jgi:hypothetical protein
LIAGAQMGIIPFQYGEFFDNGKETWSQGMKGSVPVALLQALRNSFPEMEGAALAGGPNSCMVHE